MDDGGEKYFLLKSTKHECYRSTSYSWTETELFRAAGERYSFLADWEIIGEGGTREEIGALLKLLG